MKKTIDINCDLGEMASGSLDRQIMPFISSCNIACGGHSGDESTMRRTVLLARANKVAIGAHPSYPDKANFGRRSISMEVDELMTSIKNQIHVLTQIAAQFGSKLHHVKPHGALYHDVCHNVLFGQPFIQTVKDMDNRLMIYGQAGSVLEEICQDENMRFCGEAFTDRQYDEEGFLLSRNLPGSVLEDPELVLEQLENIVFQGQVVADNGDHIPMFAQTLCLHSDTPGAIKLAALIHHHLTEEDVWIRAPR